jgi:hypothetical protein
MVMGWISCFKSKTGWYLKGLKNSTGRRVLFLHPFKKMPSKKAPARVRQYDWLFSFRFILYAAAG